LAALGYLTDGVAINGLIDVEKLTLIILYDEQLSPKYCALRLAGYSAGRVPWGICIGGPKQCRFFKDLGLQPVPGGLGYRLDLADERLLTQALGLERTLVRCARYQHRQIREQVRLPMLWAAFHPTDAVNLIGDGPELTAYAQRTSKSPQHLLKRLQRDHLGMILFPFTWVSHHWQQTVAVFADLDRFPKQQVFRLWRFPDGLVGFQDAIEFDFHQARPSGQHNRHMPVVNAM